MGDHFRTVSIHGAPRSGTSWLGQIFNSHPDVAYRFQPLFSYRFKSAITQESTRQEIERFLEQLYAVDDDEFILQWPQKDRGAHPSPTAKNPHPTHLVMKEVRYHYVIRRLLSSIPDIKIIGIVRHPCGVINSWLKTPREFRPEWDALTEWRTAPSKNQGRPEEYYGFEKWKELASLFIKLKDEYPDKFLLVRYEELVSRPLATIQRLFSNCGLSIPSQTLSFLESSQSREIDDPDTVFRRPDVADRWLDELPPQIRDTILREVAATDLKVFL